tara:strand:- start:1 stop:201 length:201 start_codon:yes stop_codon:yes gene_type:complete
MTKRMHEVLSRFSRSKAKEKRERSMNHVLVNPVDVNGNGTSGYLIKNGPNKGKVLKHLKVKHQNKF